jgi:hypothetical protein
MLAVRRVATGVLLLWGHRYVETGLDLYDDGTDGSYTFFVEVDTLEVAAAFYSLINTP